MSVVFVTKVVYTWFSVVWAIFLIFLLLGGISLLSQAH